MRYLFGLLLAFALSSGPLLAQEDDGTIDVKDMSCGNLVELAQEEGNEEGLGLVVFWIDGYLSGVSGDTRVNFDALANFAEGLATFCAANPETDIISAARQVGLN